MGGIDILINNAGAALARVAVDQFDADQARRIVHLNQHAVTEAICVALPHFRQQQRGVIINTTSIAARNGGGFGASLYASAKGAVEALTRSLARDEAQYGVRVNCVAPGYIDTPIHKETAAGQIQRYLDATPLGRAGTRRRLRRRVSVSCLRTPECLRHRTDDSGQRWHAHDLARTSLHRPCKSESVEPPRRQE